MTASAPARAFVRNLPLTNWATRFADGRITLHGTTAGAATRLELTFTGGDEPAWEALRRDDEDIDANAVAALVDTLHDLHVEVEATAAREVRIRGHALADVLIPRGATVQLDARSYGPATAPRLLDALRLRCDDCRITLNGSRWISDTAQIRLTQATLQPDGRVDIEGTARGLLEGALRAALGRVSDELTALVRADPRWRRFLRETA